MNRHPSRWPAIVNNLEEVEALSKERWQVLFDPESLLLEPTAGIVHSLRWAMAEFGYEVPDQWLTPVWSLNRPFEETLRGFWGSRDAEAFRLVCERFAAYYRCEGRYRCTLRPGSIGLLAELAADDRFELHYLTHVGVREAQRVLQTYGLQHVPRSIVTSDDPSCPGLRLEILRECCERDPEQQWVVLSDHPWELLAAKQMGIKTVALGYGRCALPNLCGLEPDSIAANPYEVASLLRAFLCCDPLRPALHSPCIH